LAAGGRNGGGRLEERRRKDDGNMDAAVCTARVRALWRTTVAVTIVKCKCEDECGHVPSVVLLGATAAWSLRSPPPAKTSCA